MDRNIDDLVGYLSQSANLDPALARRLIGDVLAHFGETLEAYVQRRHRELTVEGLKNDDIYDRLVEEVAGRPFALPVPSRRQIRRLIYG